MKSYWSDKAAKKLKNNPLKLRVYSSRLLGKEPDLVLHGGGNTSVKVREKNLFKEEEEILYVKGSGWDLATIEAEGFAPVKLDTLFKMAKLNNLSDTNMVKFQRAAMTNPAAPNPSVEAILHAIIPFKFVDHTHADAVVTVSNTPNGKNKIKELYGEDIIIVPYVMPGFILAKAIYEQTKNTDWSKIRGMVLLNHGVFTFADDAKTSYENMIQIVSEAEDYLKKQKASFTIKTKKGKTNTLQLAAIRKKIAEIWGKPILAQLNNSPYSNDFSQLTTLKKITSRGPLTPDHVIRTKRIPAILDKKPLKEIEQFEINYNKYFEKFNDGKLTCLDPAPRWAVWKDHGTIYFGPNVKSLNIIKDITNHTIKSIRQAEILGGWKALPQKDIFEMEYWVLEQAKLKKAKSALLKFEGKVAIVTGAASGIGKACVIQLIQQGATVIAIDKQPKISTTFQEYPSVLPIVCDVTKSRQINNAIEKGVNQFGGIDMIVSNAGMFPKSMPLKEMDGKTWQNSIEINLTSHQKLIKACIPYLELGIKPAIVIIASKNVPAPGPGAAAYSAAKAGLTQLARVAALELGGKNIRVNVLHPNAVYDTGIWTEEVLNARAKHYGLSVEDYKTNNILKREVTSNDVATLAAELLSDTFSKVTGAQLPIDGGNERVI